MEATEYRKVKLNYKPHRKPLGAIEFVIPEGQQVLQATSRESIASSIGRQLFQQFWRTDIWPLDVVVFNEDAKTVLFNVNIDFEPEFLFFFPDPETAQHQSETQLGHPSSNDPILE